MNEGRKLDTHTEDMQFGLGRSPKRRGPVPQVRYNAVQRQEYQLKLDFQAVRPTLKFTARRIKLGALGQAKPRSNQPKLSNYRLSKRPIGLNAS